MELPKLCNLCPRNCNIDRTKQQGFCHAGSKIKVARAALHHWEEPCISGTNGSGTVFFSGCNLQCIYCQNYKISAENFGMEISVNELADIFLNLQAKNAHNINLVTAAHYVPLIINAIDIARPKLNIPIVYNTSGYESSATLDLLKGYVDIYLTDLKYFSKELSKKYSNAENYFDVASNALLQMINQVSEPQYDKNNILQKGVIVRHMVLPFEYKDSIMILDWLKNNLKANSWIISLMSQYTPFYKASQIEHLNRRISTFEYNKVLNHAITLDLTNGYMQEKSSAKEEYTPVFNLEGIL